MLLVAALLLAALLYDHFRPVLRPWDAPRLLLRERAERSPVGRGAVPEPAPCPEGCIHCYLRDWEPGQPLPGAVPSLGQHPLPGVLIPAEPQPLTGPALGRQRQMERFLFGKPPGSLDLLPQEDGPALRYARELVAEHTAPAAPWQDPAEDPTRPGRPADVGDVITAPFARMADDDLDDEPPAPSKRQELSTWAAVLLLFGLGA